MISLLLYEITSFTQQGRIWLKSDREDNDVVTKNYISNKNCYFYSHKESRKK